MWIYGGYFVIFTGTMAQPRTTTDISGMLAMLPEDKQKLYINTLYSIARTALEARCGAIRLGDVQILQSLEDESNARFEDWIFR